MLYWVQNRTLNCYDEKVQMLQYFHLKDIDNQEHVQGNTMMARYSI